MRSSYYTLVLLVLFVAGSGCGRSPSPAAQLQAAGGVATLKSECAGLIGTFQQTGGERSSWAPGDTNLPPGIASLKPLAVTVVRQGDAHMVDLRMAGGSKRRGLLVVTDPLPANQVLLVPDIPNHCIGEIAEGVFEYYER